MIVRLRRSQAMVCIVLMACLTTSCMRNVSANPPQETSLQKISNALNSTTKSMTLIQTTVANANATTPPLIPTGTARSIMDLSLRFDKTIGEAITAGQKIAKLNTSTGSQLTVIIAPMVTAIDNAVKDPAILGIQDVKTRDTIRTTLVAIQTSLSTVQLIIATNK